MRTGLNRCRAAHKAGPDAEKQAMGRESTGLYETRIAGRDEWTVAAVIGDEEQCNQCCRHLIATDFGKYCFGGRTGCGGGGNSLYKKLRNIRATAAAVYTNSSVA
jgi:hypothetical protein